MYTGSALEGLKGRYVFGDFASGRLWAMELPQEGVADRVLALGKWPILISTFGRDASGELYVGDYSSGRVFRITGP